MLLLLLVVVFAEQCRGCLFNTDLYKSTRGNMLPDLVECPCCVSAMYNKSAANEAGPTCASPLDFQMLLEACSSACASYPRPVQVGSESDAVL